MDAIYEVHGLTKRYGRTAALNGVDFAVTPGKLVGLLGPNGSGKTTLMKISAGLLQPTAGSVIIDKVPVGVFTKAVTSYLPDRMALPTEFTADDGDELFDQIVFGHPTLLNNTNDQRFRRTDRARRHRRR